MEEIRITETQAGADHKAGHCPAATDVLEQKQEVEKTEWWRQLQCWALRAEESKQEGRSSSYFLDSF